MKQFRIFTGLVLAVCFGLTSCTSDDDINAEPTNEEEVITTVVLEFKNGSQTIEARYQVLNGEVLADYIALDANTAYTVSAQFLNEEAIPTENVTEEIVEEANEHLVCYIENLSDLVTVEYNDADANGIPIGLQTIWTTSGIGEGAITVALRHQPDLKENNRDADCNLGETDVEATFPIIIQ